jgi:hypothetical protein
MSMLRYVKPHKLEIKALTEYAEKHGKTYTQVFGEIRGKSANRRTVVDVIQTLKAFNTYMSDVYKEKRGKNYVHMYVHRDSCRLDFHFACYSLDK